MEENKKSEINQSYYDEDYFVKGAKRVVDANTGEEKVWGYKGTDWSGNYFIVNGLLKTFNAEIGSVLDIGAGQGSFTDYAIRAGLVAKGYDYSEWAVNNPHNYAKGHLFQSDAESIPEKDNTYDLIFCSDMLEHIFKSRVDIVIKEFYRITRKWVFLQFPVVVPEERFDMEKDDETHSLYAHFKIAGHVNMETRQWWDKLFKENGFEIRDDLVINFRGYVPRPVLMNWHNVVILYKKER